MYLWLTAGVVAGVALAAVFPSQDLVDGFVKVAPTAALVAISGYVANYLIKQITQTLPQVSVDWTPATEGTLPASAEQPLQLADRPGMIQCWNPATGEHLGELPVTEPEEVPGIVAAARDAQRAWASTSFEERRRVLKTMNATMLRYRDEICRVSVIDTGKTRLEALMGEIMVSGTKFAWVCDHGEEALAREERKVPLVMSHKTAAVEWHPLGVLGIIAPWNYPFHNLYNHIASGLFAGNAVVLKVSEFTAWSGDISIRLARRVLEECGHDPNLVTLVQGFAPTGAALVSGGVDKVIFTGSPGIGKHVMRGAADTLTPVVLELGGKDPFVITEDADLSQVVQIALRGAYQNCGQNCVGAERFYVYESVYEEFIDKAAALVRNFQQGPPIDPKTQAWTSVDVGSTTTAAQVQHVKRLVDDAKAKGARAVVGGDVNTALGKTGLFFQPTILADVTHDMEIANEEVFGPVMTVIKVPHNSDEALLDMLNSVQYGLGSSVFAKNTARADAIARQIYAGMTSVNDFAVGYLMQDLPFGGVKVSGFNRFAGKEGLRECCLQKSVVSDRFAALGLRTSIPPKLAYPNQGDATAAFADGLIDLQYAPTLWQRIAAIAKLV